MSDDFVLDDHRHSGADRYLESVAALCERIPDARSDVLYNGVVDRHGRVCVSRTWGHDREGGEVESFLVVLMHHPGEKLSLVEVFEVEHLDAALARVEELRPQSSDTTLAP